MHAEDESMDIEEQGAIDKETQQRYRIWKKNSPFLYDYVSTHSLLWPSLTVQFFPDLEKSETERAKSPQSLVYQRILLGSFTLGQGTDTVSIWQLPYYRDLNQGLNVDLLDYNPDKQEFELPAASKNKLRNLQLINHWGDVNKLRYMPQNADVIASSNNMGDLVVYNRTKHSNIKTLGNENEINDPQLRLVNQAKRSGEDIFAFDWNNQAEGVITAGSMDGTINIFDIKSDYRNKDNTSIDVVRYYETGVGINDIEWVPTHNTVFLSADDSGDLKLFDSRSNSTGPSATQKSGIACNSLSINHNGFSVVSGHSDGSANIFDIRSLGQGSVVTFRPHSDSITQVRWHPIFASVLGTSSTDKLVKLHDLANAEHNDGLFFTHEGHMLGVNDFDWSLHEDWMVASVADDNTLHVWKPAQKVLRS